MLSLMSLCWDRSGENSKSLEELEGPYQLSLREIATITHIDHTALRNRQGKAPRLGILDHLQQIRYVTIRTGRPIDDITGEPGREQIYLYIHLRKIWEDNETFAENWRVPKNRLVAPYQVEFTNTVDENNVSVDHVNSHGDTANTHVDQNNTTVDDASTNSVLIPNKTNKILEDKSKIIASSQSSDAPHSLFHQLACKGNLSEAIIALVEEKRCLTIPSLQKALEPYMTTKGERSIHLTKSEHWRVWEDMSQQFMETTLELINSHKVLPDYGAHNTRFYEKEKTGLNYPVMNVGDQVTTHHWLPCVFRPISDEHPF